MPESVTTLGRLVRNEVPQVVTLLERIALIMTIQSQLITIAQKLECNVVDC